MIRLEMKNCNTILIEKQPLSSEIHKYEYLTNIYEYKKFYDLINNK